MWWNVCNGYKARSPTTTTTFHPSSIFNFFSFIAGELWLLKQTESQQRGELTDSCEARHTFGILIIISVEPATLDALDAPCFCSVCLSVCLSV